MNCPFELFEFSVVVSGNVELSRGAHRFAHVVDDRLVKGRSTLAALALLAEERIRTVHVHARATLVARHMMQHERLAQVARGQRQRLLVVVGVGVHLLDVVGELEDGARMQREHMRSADHVGEPVVARETFDGGAYFARARLLGGGGSELGAGGGRLLHELRLLLVEVVRDVLHGRGVLDTAVVGLDDERHEALEDGQLDGRVEGAELADVGVGRARGEPHQAERGDGGELARGALDLHAEVADGLVDLLDEARVEVLELAIGAHDLELAQHGAEQALEVELVDDAPVEHHLHKVLLRFVQRRLAATG